LGVSHHATEDISIMRAIPNILICSPSDPNESSRIATLMANYQGPAYIRLNKNNEENLSDKIRKFNIGDINKIIDGSKTAILSTGAITGSIKNDCIKKGFSLYSFPFPNYFKKSNLLKIVHKYERIVTIEENQLNGGFGSIILENINNFLNSKKIKKFPIIIRKGIQNKFIEYSGDQSYLREKAGINIKDLK